MVDGALIRPRTRFLAYSFLETRKMKMKTKTKLYLLTGRARTAIFLSSLARAEVST